MGQFSDQRAPIFVQMPEQAKNFFLMFDRSGFKSWLLFQPVVSKGESPSLSEPQFPPEPQEKQTPLEGVQTMEAIYT